MNLKQHPQLPRTPRPILVIGAGSIVRDAHLPAYRIAGFPVFGIVDRSFEASRALADQWNIPNAYGDLESALKSVPAGTVFDVAVPASVFESILEKLPYGSAVLIQKPMGEDYRQAKRILSICRNRRLIAAVNFQLRFAPFVIAARDLIERGVIGELRDLEIRVTVETPWDHFPFLKTVPRLEVIYHSIHHLDCIRYFLGNPMAIQARSLGLPGSALPDCRSAMILDYGEAVRVNIQTNHSHAFGQKHQESYIKWEGTRGAIKAKMGLLMNYPHGVPDEFEVCSFQSGEPVWTKIPLEGSWFPHAFIGSMSQVMRAADGDPDALVTSVEDAMQTMACAEAAYASSTAGGVNPAKFV